MKPKPRSTSQGAWWRLAVLALLAFGILGMHTLGHAAGHEGGYQGGHMLMAPAAAPAQAPAAIGAVGAAPAPAPRHGFDPTSMCVAVLGSLLLAIALRVLLRGRRHTATPWTAGAELLVPRPEPPPRAPDLVRLSVLRI